MWSAAYRFMVFDKTKLIGILFGIVVSIFLVGVQLAYLDNVLDSFIGIARNNTEYIFVVDKKTASSTSLANIDTRVGYQLQSLNGVQKVHPVVVSGANCKFKSGSTSPANIIGITLPQGVGGPKHYTHQRNLNHLYEEGAVVVDVTDLGNMEDIGIGGYFTINDLRVHVSDISLGNEDLGQPNIVTTIDRARQLTGFSSNHVSCYMVETSLTSDLSKKQLVQNINSNIPAVKAFTGLDFQRVSLDYVKSTSSIMSSFTFLIGFSLATGFIVVGLTMFSSVNDRVKDYGTIKAIGGTNAYITRLIITQAILYALNGFAVAMSGLWGLQAIMASFNQTINFSLTLIVFLLLSSIIISSVGSYFSLRKILKLEPVQIFRM